MCRRPPTIAAVLFCSRASVYRTVQAYRAGPLGLEHDAQGRLVPPVRTTVLVPGRRRSRLAWLKAPPRGYGWCRTRWRYGTRALTWQTRRGSPAWAAPRRRGLHAMGWGWTRATRVATDDDLQRVACLARLRFLSEPLRLGEALVCADALAIHWLPKGGSAWLPKGTQVEVMTPGTSETHDRAGALAVATGTGHHARGARPTKARVRERWPRRDDAYAAPYDQRRSGVVEHDTSPTAKAVEPW